jgi:sigma-B regulation protein RsbU (phosphoserine phosphatase)
MANRRDLPFLAALAILFACVVALQARLTYDSIQTEIHITEHVRTPFQVSDQGDVSLVAPEASAAGIAVHDIPVSINGTPVRGTADLMRALDTAHPGDIMQIEVDRKGQRIPTVVKLAPANATPLSIGDWVLISMLNYVTPWFCILLGFFVALLRPRDVLAWLLLLLMLSFKELWVPDVTRLLMFDWSSWMRSGAVFFSASLGASWPIAMMLFGQYFPDRRANKPLDRILRWGLGVPLAAVALLAAFAKTWAITDIDAARGINLALDRAALVVVIAGIAATSTFFVNLARKTASAQNRDDKRRLKLLYTGATISLTPLFLIVLASLVFHYSLSGLAGWIIVPSLLMLFLFPLTLAYVIVVEKAMELRVVIRQGLQYALAKRGLRILMAIVIVGVLLLALEILNDRSLSRPKQLMVLAIAVLVVVRLRMVLEKLRAWLDRRFFREAVNAERVLNELGDSVRTIIEVQPLLATVTKTISTTMHVPRVAALLRGNGHYATAHAIGFTSEPEVVFAANGPLAGRLEKAREPERVYLNRPDSWTAQDLADRKQLEQLQTELLLPLAVKDRLLGFLSLGPKLSEEPYSPSDVQLLQSVAAQTGLALENTRLTEAVANEVAQRERLNRELEIAREVQQRLFPQAGPAIEGLDYCGKCRPASSVGGDYYDFVSMCDGRLGIAIGDISGKGVPAALLMASLQASLRGLAIANPPALSTLMENLNRLIFDASPSNKYATFFYGVYDPKTREFVYVNGGHNPPMIFRGNEVLRLEDGGPVIGLFGPAQYTQSSIQLQSGDTMVLFTDGVSEAMNNEDEEFDEPRLMEAVRASSGLTAAGIIDRVMAACDEFAAGAPQHDDMTLVVARVQ